MTEICRYKYIGQGALIAALLAWNTGAAAQTVFKDTFGNTSTRTSSPYVPQFSGAGMTSYYQYADPLGTSAALVNSQRVLLDGFYAVINPQNIRDPMPPANFPAPPASPNTSQTGSWWATGAPSGDYRNFRDHTGDNGAVMAVNAGNTQNHMYRRLVTLQPGKTYNFSVWLFMVQAPGSTQLSLREPDDTAALGTSQAFVVQSANDPALHKWTQRSWKFTLPITCTQTDYAVAYSNLSPVASGNDLFFDDVELAETTDTTGAATASCATAPAVLPKVTTLPDAASTATGAAVTINVTGNDASSDPVNAALGAPHADTSSTAVNPANGTIAYTGGQVVYTPNPGFAGQDSFTYEVCTAPSAIHPTVVCKTETVTVTVVGVNTVPDSASTTPGTAVQIDVKANDSSTDPTGSPLGTPTTVTQPAKGTVTWDANGVATYTPNPGVQGTTDSFTYEICTTGAVVTCSTPTTVTITIASVVVTASPGNGTTQPGVPVTIPVTYSSSDPTVQLGTPTTVTPPTNGAVTWINGQPQYTPNPGFNGPSDSFTYQVCTAAGVTPQVCSTPQTVTVTVTVAAPPTPVPANATWALGLLGMSLLGFGARRMRRNAKQ